MITGLFISLMGMTIGGISTVAGTVPVPSPDGFLGPVATGVALINNHVVLMDHWVPLSSVGPLVAAIGLFIGLTIALRLARLVISGVTGGGFRA